VSLNPKPFINPKPLVDEQRLKPPPNVVLQTYETFMTCMTRLVLVFSRPGSLYSIIEYEKEILLLLLLL
jgi:hypothetical protein